MEWKMNTEPTYIDLLSTLEEIEDLIAIANENIANESTQVNKSML